MLARAILDQRSLVYTLLASPFFSGGRTMADWAEDEFGAASLGAAKWVRVNWSFQFVQPPFLNVQKN